MSLLFNNDFKKRAYRCFVCSVDFESYEEFRGHIIEDHEEGREYILCKRCEAPVRDMSMHYKAKHPQAPKPRGQLKAMVWKDTGGRKKKTIRHRQGDFISAKNGGRMIHYRSGWEEKVYSLLEQWNEVVSYTGESVRIPYLWKGREHNYIPDLVIDFIHGREIWEIKPSNQTGIKQNQAKWASAKQWCLAGDMKFMVLTEDGMKKLWLLLKEQQAGG